jgi:DNA-binding PadR family transcriptional regulator
MASPIAAKTTANALRIQVAIIAEATRRLQAARTLITTLPNVLPATRLVATARATHCPLATRAAEIRGEAIPAVKIIPPSTLTRRVDRLVGQGLIERARQPNDSRVVVVRLTKAGLALLRRAARTHLGGIRAHLTGQLSEDQLTDVAVGLEVVAGPHREH